MDQRLLPWLERDAEHATGSQVISPSRFLPIGTSRVDVTGEDQSIEALMDAKRVAVFDMPIGSKAVEAGSR
jgi:hypothetical protein